MASSTEIDNLTYDSTNQARRIVQAAAPTSPSSIGDGRKVVAAAATAETLAVSTACKTVVITAETDNTGVISVGASDVVAALATRKGTPLNAGDSVSIDIDNLSKVYLDTTVSGDGVTYTYTA
jgi:hypothetical protein